MAIPMNPVLSQITDTAPQMPRSHFRCSSSATGGIVKGTRIFPPSASPASSFAALSDDTRIWTLFNNPHNHLQSRHRHPALVLPGVLFALYSIALDSADPIAEIALEQVVNRTRDEHAVSLRQHRSLPQQAPLPFECCCLLSSSSAMATI